MYNALSIFNYLRRLWISLWIQEYLLSRFLTRNGWFLHNSGIRWIYNFHVLIFIACYVILFYQFNLYLLIAWIHLLLQVSLSICVHTLQLNFMLNYSTLYENQLRLWWLSLWRGLSGVIKYLCLCFFHFFESLNRTVYLENSWFNDLMLE